MSGGRDEGEEAAVQTGPPVGAIGIPQEASRHSGVEWQRRTSSGQYEKKWQGL